MYRRREKAQKEEEKKTTVADLQYVLYFADFGDMTPAMVFYARALRAWRRFACSSGLPALLAASCFAASPFCFSSPPSIFCKLVLTYFQKSTRHSIPHIANMSGQGSSLTHSVRSDRQPTSP